ncbi:MAG TPA: beta-galactosidase [Bryobacteraceae bacterium]
MRVCTKIPALLLFLATLCGAAELILPGPALERDHPVTVIYKAEFLATGKGTLHVRWTDSYGRVIEDRTILVVLTDENEIRFPLDLRRAVAMQNHLHVHFSFAGVNNKGKADHREEDADASFIARPPDPKWWDYMIIMWQDGTAKHYRQLEKVGVNAGKSAQHSGAIPEPLLSDNLRWYVENMATDFYSAYHIWSPDRPYNYSFLQARARYRKNPASIEALKRHPSFSDPWWLHKIHDRLVRFARADSPYRPIFYNLADESGIAELAGFWDFDFSDYSLDGMRRWLKKRYGTLAALNKEWGTHFTAWYLVTPDTTKQAMQRTDGNYSSWGDFKEWMDIAYARALKVGVDAVHSVDPHAYVGIEGAQMPGWGGYDYARLTSVLDMMEPYDIGDNIEIIRSLNPHFPFITTAFATGPVEKHRVWYEFLHGAHGQIIWDPKPYDIVKSDGTLGPRGRDVAPYWNELRDGIGALLINSTRQADPIAIHYSQPSMRINWMLAQRPKGDAWMSRMSWDEPKDMVPRLRDSYCRLIEDHGLQYNFVSYKQVKQGDLSKGGYRILILPRSLALSKAEATAITNFVHEGGTLIVDGNAGTYDQHCRRLPQSSLAGVLSGNTGRGKVVHMNALHYREKRITGAEAPVYGQMTKVLAEAGVAPRYRVARADGRPMAGIETQVFRDGGVSIVGLDSNPPVEQDNLGPLKKLSQKRFQKPQPIHLITPQEMYAYDIRRAKPLGKVKDLSLTIDPYEPTIIAFSPTPLPNLEIRSPRRIRRGETARIGFMLEGHFNARHDVLHVAVLGPDGKPISRYSGNILMSSQGGEKTLPLALNDPAGTWTIAVHDLLSGQKRKTTIDVL